MRLPRIWLAVVFLFCFAPVGTVWGDVGPPVIINFPTVRFDNLDDYPDFKFFLKYGCGSGNPYASPHLLRIQSGESFRLEGGRRRTEIVLLAVPRGQQLFSISADAPDWLGKSPAGCLQSVPLEGTYAESGWLVPYRVHIENGKLEAAVQPGEWQPGEWSLLWLKRLPCILVPIAFCAALGWLGARAARRLFSSKRTRSDVVP